MKTSNIKAVFLMLSMIMLSAYGSDLTSAPPDSGPPTSSTSRTEMHSTLQFTLAYANAKWCPEKHAMVAKVLRPADTTWAKVAADEYTVYVDGSLVQTDAYRINEDDVTVCLPVSGPHKVLIFGPDSKGRPAKFDSLETPISIAN